MIPLKPTEGLTPISCHAVLERSACAPFIKERRMGCINATSLRRKSGQMGHPALLPVWQKPVFTRPPEPSKDDRLGNLYFCYLLDECPMVKRKPTRKVKGSDG